jgi:hypothetical protein
LLDIVGQESLAQGWPVICLYVDCFLTSACISIAVSGIAIGSPSGTPEDSVMYLFTFQVRIYKTIILPVVPYGCETWSLTLRDERRLRVFENRVLRRIFGPKTDGVTGGWRKLHNEELHNLYVFAKYN